MASAAFKWPRPCAPTPPLPSGVETPQLLLPPFPPSLTSLRHRHVTGEPRSCAIVECFSLSFVFSSRSKKDNPELKGQGLERYRRRVGRGRTRIDPPEDPPPCTRGDTLYRSEGGERSSGGKRTAFYKAVPPPHPMAGWRLYHPVLLI